MYRRLFKKAFRDLFSDTRKTLIAMAAIMVGMIAFGTLYFSYEMITGELITTYSSTNPPSASINVDYIDETFIDITEGFNDIADFEVKSYYKMRGQTTNGEWVTLELFALDNFESLHMNKVFFVEGMRTPSLNEMLIERDAIAVAGKDIGDTLLITLPDGSEKEMKITGVINDIGVHPATMHNTIYAYVSMDTLQAMGLVPNRIDILVEGDSYNRQSILTISNEYMRLLENNGYQIRKLEVEDTPGISMHLDEYKAALFMLRTFAFAAFLFGCLIMSSLVSSIMSRQIKQIGILKSFGTTTGQITISYISALLLFIVAAGLLSLPLSKVLANIISAPLLRISNITLVHTKVPPFMYIFFLCTCLILPPIIAYISVRKGTKTTIQEAVNDSGLSRNLGRTTLLKGSKWIQRPVLLTLRNALYRKGRFALNVSTLALSGVCLITVLVSMFSVQSTLKHNMNTFGYDYRFTVGKTSEAQVHDALNTVPQIEHFEYWGFTSGKLVFADNRVGNSFPVTAVPNESNLINPQLMAGRWITENDMGGIVVGHEFAQNQNSEVGDIVLLDIAGTKLELQIVGIIKDFSGPNIYMSENFYYQSIPQENRQDMVQVKLNSNLRGRSRANLIKEIEEIILGQGVSILESETKAKAIAILNSHYMATFQTFLIVIIMVVIVSSFGLASTTNIQTLERTKEIGIMKSMGADKKKIIKIVTSESVFVGLCGWALSAILAIPGIFIALAYFSANTLEAPIQFNGFAVIASYVIWLLLIMIISKKASKSSALRAATMTIKESLLSD